MPAFVEHDFQRGFLLDEVQLRKIHDLINARVSQYSPPLSPTYKVYRADGYSYDTHSVDDVAREDSEDWRKITKLEVLVHSPDTLDFRLTFSQSGTATLEIKGAARDNVQLLLSDVREYIQNEVATIRRLPDAALYLVTFFVVSLTMLGFFVYFDTLFTSSDPALETKALATTDTLEKLNFIIQQRTREREQASGIPLAFVALLLGSLVILYTTLFGLERVWNTLFPSNIFLFGTRKTKYEKKRALKHNLFWGVGVALAVGVAVAYIVK